MVKYVEILFRYKFRFALLLVLLPALAGGVTVLMFPRYNATAQLWVDDPSYFGGATPTGWSQYLTPAQNEAAGLQQLLLTRQFSEDLYTRLAADIPDPGERIQAIAGAKITIFASGTYLLVAIVSCDKQPVCLYVLDRTIEALRDESIQMEKDNASAGVAFLTAQLKQAQANQSSADDALRKYVVLHPGAKIDADPTTITDPDLAKLATDVQSARAAVNTIQEQINRNQAIASASTAQIQSGPRVVDQPAIVKGGIIGDGSGVKKGGMAGGATLALGLGYLLLLGWLDKTVRDPREIEHRFKVPVVTTIPELQPAERF